MKILEINKFYFLGRGAEKHFFSVTNLLKKHHHEVAVFSMADPENYPSPWSEHFVSEVGYTKGYSLWKKIKGVGRMFYSRQANRRLGKILDDFRPDIVHIHNVYHQIPPTILFEIKKRRIPVVMTVHDYKIISPNYNLYLKGEFYNRCNGGKYYRCVLDKCVKNSYVKSFLAMLEMYWHKKLGSYEKNVDCYIAPSEFVKKILVASGVAREKVLILPHFISPRDHAGGDDEHAESGNFAFYFGSVSRNKNVDRLMELFRGQKDIGLHLAGRPEEDLIGDGISNVKFLGVLSPDELANHIKKSKFIVSMSKLPETFGLIALEAIAEGKPFVGFRTGAFPEIIESGQNGILVEDEEELAAAVRDIVSGKIIFDEEKIKKEARQKFDAEKYYQALIGIFSSFVER